jgi:phosphatidylglycerol:prolipoprotein diacylglycerol transferase
MLHFPAIDPVAVRLGPLAVHWYGLAYLAGIGCAWLLLGRRAAAGHGPLSREQVGDLVFALALGAVLGGRLGYILFYNPQEYLRDPLSVLAVWRGGMSFHGGVPGFVTALALQARRTGKGFLVLADFVLPVVPIGLFFGRLANFINQELWGRASDLPWAVLFPHPAAGGIPRHPSQLYEALLEGVVLGLLLHLLWLKRSAVGTVAGSFLLGYGIFRGAIEFLREPDAHIGYLWSDWLTMGQVLSLPMAGAGLWLILRRRSLST